MLLWMMSRLCMCFIAREISMSWKIEGFNKDLR